MSDRRKAWLIIGLSALAILSLLTAKIFVSPPPVCEPSASEKTVVVLDHSEGVSTQTAAAIVNRTWAFIESKVADGERVSVFMLSQASQKDLKPVFTGCKPRHDGNRTIEDVKRVKADFEKRFKKPLEEQLALPITNSPESPIAEGLIDLSLDVKHFRSTGSTKLLVFSDFLQHSSALSLYKCTDGPQAVQQFRTARSGKQERPEFKNTEVQMHVIPRAGISRAAVQCRAYYWNWFFGDTSCKGSVCVAPEYLPG